MKSLDSDKKAAKPVEEAPKAEEKVDFSNVKIEPIFKEMVDFETFAKSEGLTAHAKSISVRFDEM